MFANELTFVHKTFSIYLFPVLRFILLEWTVNILKEDLKFPVNFKVLVHSTFEVCK